jgi:hypothetical protein
MKFWMGRGVARDAPTNPEVGFSALPSGALIRQSRLGAVWGNLVASFWI